jgi:AhpD family alkylhydroperoxidase
MRAERLLPIKVAPEGYQALRAVEAYLARSGLPKSLIDLVKLRASQINGCAYCLDVHSSDARKQGESEPRLYLLNAWREAPHYTPAERAALAWTEALTNIAGTHAPDADYEALRAHFSDKEIVDLTYLIGMINFRNRSRPRCATCRMAPRRVEGVARPHPSPHRLHPGELQVRRRRPRHGGGEDGRQCAQNQEPHLHGLPIGDRQEQKKHHRKQQQRIDQQHEIHSPWLGKECHETGFDRCGCSHSSGSNPTAPPRYQL